MDDYDLGLLVRDFRCASVLVYPSPDASSFAFLQDDTEYMTAVLRQKMLGMFPVFMYRAKEKQPGEEYL